jgi:hypothetical protein
MVRPELGAVAFDEWAIDGARLSRALVRDALGECFPICRRKRERADAPRRAP